MRRRTYNCVRAHALQGGGCPAVRSPDFIPVFGLVFFVDPEVEFLRSVLPPTTDPAFFQFLRGLDCSDVTLRSVPEGTVVFARVSSIRDRG